MIKLIQLSASALEKVLYEQTKFHLALRDVFVQEEEKSKTNNTISTLLGCELRHHYFISHAFKEIEEELTNEEKCLLYIALANNLFSKKVDEQVVIKYMAELLPDHESFLLKLLNFKGSPKELIPEYLPPDALETLSLQYNAPEWLMKMWHKQFGFHLMKKMLIRNIRPSLITCRVNPLITNKEDFLKVNPTFKDTKVQDMVLYYGKTPLRQHRAFLNYEVFLLKLGFKEILDKVDGDHLKEVFLYSEDDKSLVREVLLRFQKRARIHLGVSLEDDKNDIDKIIKYNQLENINFFVAESSKLNEEINELMDLVITHPQSSRFDLIRTYPDYLIHFDTKQFETLIKNQSEILENCAPFVKEEGHLLYLVTTINKKESRSVVNQFLAKHPEFSLVEQKQLLPFDRFDSSMYYALLRREVKE